MAHRPTGCFLAGVTGPGITASGEALLASVSDIRTTFGRSFG